MERSCRSCWRLSCHSISARRSSSSSSYESSDEFEMVSRDWTEPGMVVAEGAGGRRVGTPGRECGCSARAHLTSCVVPLELSSGEPQTRDNRHRRTGHQLPTALRHRQQRLRSATGSFALGFYTNCHYLPFEDSRLSPSPFSADAPCRQGPGAALWASPCSTRYQSLLAWVSFW